LSQFGHLADNGEGSVFRDFVGTSFMDGPLGPIYTGRTLTGVKLNNN